MINITRKSTPPIKVYCLPHEREEIKVLAAASGKTVSSYLLAVGLGYRTKSILDNRRIEELVKINGDLGRLGGLLKLWLTNDERTAKFGESTIRAVLSKITDTQESMHEVIRKVVLPKS
ncbi:conjugal transfer transcriptional regulator TraJ [Massilia sp. PWRC2]|uniref:conjugal transfer transcriptional regulator TraJ n=1 Tax=Massilia sp. PWRC2 TaxID=2804626 RepID=UPI003CE7872F